VTTARLKLFLLGLAFLCSAFAVGVFQSAHADTTCSTEEECAALLEKYGKKYESTSKKLATIRGQQDSINSRIKTYLAQLSVTQAELDSLQTDIQKIKTQLTEIQSNLDDRKETLAKKTTIRNKIVRNYYTTGRPTGLELLFAFNSPQNTGMLSGFSYFNNRDAYEDSVSTEAIKAMTSLNVEITNFEADKKEASDLKASLEESQKKLLSLKSDIDVQKLAAQTTYSDLDKKSKDYEKELSSLSDIINDLSAKQQQILDEKGGGDSGGVGDYEPPQATLPEPRYHPAFVAISYGAYTHYKGMSQYGAKGRAEDGQDYKEILHFYYKTDTTKKSDFPDDICVSGYGTMAFQKYLYGLAEMPASWHEDALKAQAIAGRSYAYRYVKAGNCICTSQACQVFSKSKSDNPPARWKKAVDDTKDTILASDVVAYYSSTTGGYIEGVGWDSKGNWPNGAYEKKGGSPWFYKAWYTKSYGDNSTCGRSDPYLNQEEMADILNAVVVLDRKGSDSRISPVTTSCWGGNPYSLSQLANLADDYGKKFTSVSSVSVEIGNNGRTSKVKFQTNQGSFEVEGEKFKTVFNLRAPGYISIKDRLFDLLKK
jgi:peptidoglycan hydrolase-like amidase